MSEVLQSLPPGATKLLDSDAVRQGFDDLAAQLQPLVAERDCVLLGIMNGGLYPLMQLVQRLRGDYLVDYCHATRYRDGTRGGELQWLREPPHSVAGRTVVLIDDIYDEGYTLHAAAETCRRRGATAVLTVVGLVKDNPRRATGTLPDFSTGLVVPDVYVIGCGMDYAGRWRHLDAVYGLSEEGML